MNPGRAMSVDHALATVLIPPHRIFSQGSVTRSLFGMIFPAIAVQLSIISAPTQRIRRNESYVSQ